jgi:hypothetical protein
MVTKLSSGKTVDLGRKPSPPMKTAYKRSVRAIDGFRGNLSVATAQIR